MYDASFKKKCMYDCLSCAILPKIDTNLCLGHIIQNERKKKQIEVKIESKRISPLMLILKGEMIFILFYDNFCDNCFSYVYIIFLISFYYFDFHVNNYFSFYIYLWLSHKLSHKWLFK